MDDRQIRGKPVALDAIEKDTRAIGFDMASEPKTGALLRALAASKPAGRLLELGTGTGVGTAWLLAGMDAQSRLESVDNDPAVQEIARRHLGRDSRMTLHLADAGEFLKQAPAQAFDVLYADAWTGKFSHLDDALAVVKIGGIYVVDDLLPQPNWPEGHASRVQVLLGELESKSGFAAVRLAWASGLMMLVRTRAS